MLARRLDPPADPPRPRITASEPLRPAGRWRHAGKRPTRDPRGRAVHWWHRPAPRGDEALWRAVMSLQEERLRVGLTVTDLGRRLAADGHPLRRETLSRILQGKQPTTWATAEALARALGVMLEKPTWPRTG